MRILIALIVALTLTGCGVAQTLFRGQQDLATSCADIVKSSDECFARLYANQEAAYKTLVKRYKAGRIPQPKAQELLTKLDAALVAIIKADGFVDNVDLSSANAQIAIAIAILTELETL